MVPDSAGAIPLRETAAQPPLTEASAWGLVVALAARIRQVGPVARPVGLRFEAGALHGTSPEAGVVVARPDLRNGWSWPHRGRGRAHGSARQPDPAVAQLLDLYMPLCVGPVCEDMIVAHLAQSLDGKVATANGVSQFISDRPDLVHTHRMRALFDAVVVGANTVEHDNPQLTTRLVPGGNPVRVVLDPRGRLRPEHRVFCDDQGPALLVRGTGSGPSFHPQTTVIEVELDDGLVPVGELIARLAGRGLRRLFVEGGGVTVSRFLRAGAVDRIHVAVAPMILGSGRPAFTLPEIDNLDAAVQLDCRHFSMGRDVLFDCVLR